MRRITLTLAGVCVLAVSFFSCLGDIETIPCPIVERLSTNDALAGETVVIFGQNFDFANPEDYRITIGNVPLSSDYITLVDTDNSTINFRVPTEGFSGPVRVEFKYGFEKNCVEPSSSSLVLFNYSCPKVEGLSTYDAPAGEAVVIYGKNFGFPAPEDYTITIGSTQLAPEDIESVNTGNSTITFKVPLGCESGLVKVHFKNNLDEHCDEGEQASDKPFVYRPSVVSFSLLAGRINFPGYSDGLISEAMFHIPVGIDVYDDTVYVADLDNQIIRQIDSRTGFTKTLAGIPDSAGTVDGPRGLLNQPIDLAIHKGTGKMFIAEQGSCTVRMIDLKNADHAITTISGSDGLTSGDCIGAENGDNTSGDSARFSKLRGITVYDGPANGLLEVFVTDDLDKRIRRIAYESNGASQNYTSTFAGGGVLASLIEPKGVTSTLIGGTATLWFIDGVFVKSISNGQAVTTLGVAFQEGVTFSKRKPRDLATCGDGNIFIVDPGRADVLRYNVVTGKLSIFTDAGILRGAPKGIACDCENKRIYVTDSELHAVFKIQLK